MLINRLAQWFSTMVHEAAVSHSHWTDQHFEELSSCCSGWRGGPLHFHGWRQLLHTLQQIFEKTAYNVTMGWICVGATWHRMIRFRQSEGIYIQWQLSPPLGKRGGQLSSSTSIHYVSIKKNNGDRRTHRHPNCHTGKPRSGSEVHLLLNNQETLWDFFEQITVWQVEFTGCVYYWWFYTCV